MRGKMYFLLGARVCFCGSCFVLRIAHLVKCCFLDIFISNYLLHNCSVAGTGKSLLLRAIIAALRKKYAGKPDAVSVTASTGMAASNIGGKFILFFGRDVLMQFLDSWRYDNPRLGRGSAKFIEHRHTHKLHKKMQARASAVEKYTGFGNRRRLILPPRIPRTPPLIFFFHAAG
jgi:hypothetical protein